MVNLNISGGSGPQSIEQTGATSQQGKVDNLPTEPPKLPENSTSAPSGDAKSIEARANSTSELGASSRLKSALSFVGVKILNYCMGPAALVIDPKTLFSAAKKADTASAKGQQEGGLSKLKQFLNSILSPSSKKPEAKAEAKTKETIDLSEPNKEAVVQKNVETKVANTSASTTKADALPPRDAKLAQGRWDEEYGNVDASATSNKETFQEDESVKPRIENYAKNMGRIKGPALSELSNPSTIDASRLERAVRTLVQDRDQGFKMKGGEEKQQQNQLNGFIATFRQAVDDACEEAVKASKEGKPLTKEQFIDLINNKVLEGLKPKMETIEPEDFEDISKEMEDRDQRKALAQEIANGTWKPGEEREVLVDRFIGAKQAEVEWGKLMKREDMQAALGAMHGSL